MRIKGAKAFVTGGAGFIGSHIVEELLQAGAEVTVYDNFSFGRRDNLAGLSGAVRVIEGDILDYDKLAAAMAGHDLVSHHAAQLEIFLSTDDPYRDLQINTVGTLNVLRAARTVAVSKVINASSACIYGQTAAATAEDHLPIPNWGYGVSKLAAERYATIYSDYEGLATVNLRYGITYGEREWFRRVLTIFIKQAILGKPIVVFGDGKQIRDFIYVKDAVRLHNLCMESDAADGQSYNVGTGVATSVAELADFVAGVASEVLGSAPEVVREPVAEGEFSKLVPDKKRNTAELKVMLLDATKAENELGWQPVVSLREGIRREMRWAVDNLARWDKVRYTETGVAG